MFAKNNSFEQSNLIDEDLIQREEISASIGISPRLLCEDRLDFIRDSNVDQKPRSISYEKRENFTSHQKSYLSFYFFQLH